MGPNLRLAPKAGFLRPLSFWPKPEESARPKPATIAGRNAANSVNEEPASGTNAPIAARYSRMLVTRLWTACTCQMRKPKWLSVSAGRQLRFERRTRHGVHHTTILKLLVQTGERCERIMADKVRNVEVRDVEADEVWSFIGKKQKHIRPQDDPNLGDCPSSFYHG